MNATLCFMIFRPGLFLLIVRLAAAATPYGGAAELVLRTDKQTYFVGEPISLEIAVRKDRVDLNTNSRYLWKTVFSESKYKDKYELNPWTDISAYLGSEAENRINEQSLVGFSTYHFLYQKKVDSDPERIANFAKIEPNSSLVVFDAPGRYEFQVLYRGGPVDFSIEGEADRFWSKPAIWSEPVVVDVVQPNEHNADAWQLLRENPHAIVYASGGFLGQPEDIPEPLMELFQKFTDTRYAASVWRHMNNAKRMDTEAPLITSNREEIRKQLSPPIVAELDQAVLADAATEMAPFQADAGLGEEVEPVLPYSDPGDRKPTRLWPYIVGLVAVGFLGWLYARKLR